MFYFSYKLKLICDIKMQIDFCIVEFNENSLFSVCLSQVAFKKIPRGGLGMKCDIASSGK